MWVLAHRAPCWSGVRRGAVSQKVCAQAVTVTLTDSRVHGDHIKTVLM